MIERQGVYESYKNKKLRTDREKGSDRTDNIYEH